MRTLVTGGTGFLGSHICRALVGAGHTVRLLRRTTSPTDLIADLEVEHAVGDLFDPASLEAACRGIEGVVHAAAEMVRGAPLGRRLASHLDGTRHTLRAAQRTGVGRFVYVSSVAALGLPDHAPAESDEHVRPMDERHDWRGDPDAWRYGYVKHLAEGLVREAGGDGLETTILNPALVIGPGDRNVVSNLLIWRILHGRITPLVAGGANVVDVADVAEAAVAALRRGRSGERYLVCGHNRTFADLIRTTARLLGLPAPRLRLPLAAVRLFGAIAAAASRRLSLPFNADLLRAAGLYFYYDGSKARREFGLGPARPFEGAAAAAAAWYRQRASGRRPSV